MPYSGLKNFSHQHPYKVGVLVTNLGTPDAPTTKALRRYLKEFLWDPRVVEVPRPIWWLILHGIILNIRPSRSAAAYKTVWTEEGSPLLVHTKNQTAAIAKQLEEKYPNVLVRFAMRYGNPSITKTLEEMQQAGVRKLLVLPLYPQYSAATTGSTFDAISQDFQKRRWLPDLRFISHYHDDENYIAAMANKINHFWQQQGKPEKLILSYHGVPKRYLDHGDPYHCECYKTSRLLAEKLGLQANEYMTTFQSRFGREEWLKPYTDHTLQSLPVQGVKSIHVFCPGFSADCLETIEEINVENREYFIEAGGQAFEYIPALNADSDHIDALVNLLDVNLTNWQTSAITPPEETAKYAKAVGASQ